MVVYDHRQLIFVPSDMVAAISRGSLEGKERLRTIECRIVFNY